MSVLKLISVDISHIPLKEVQCQYINLKSAFKNIKLETTFILDLSSKFLIVYLEESERDSIMIMLESLLHSKKSLEEVNHAGITLLGASQAHQETGR